MNFGKQHTINKFLVLVWLLGAFSSCHKGFLDAKPSTNLEVPTTLSDFQALLDNTTVFGLVPTLGEASADNYFFTYPYWQTLDTREKNAYVWTVDIFQGQGGQQDWNTPYQQVFYANVVLDGLGSQPSQDSVAEWNALEGAALFFRAFAFYNIAQVFAPLYADSLINMPLGIPLRLHADINTPSTRSTIGQTYQQIIRDLDSAELFLPAGEPNAYRNRPIRLAAQALLARVYLSMRKYPRARAYADSALQAYSTLIDYNTLDTLNPFPIILLNAETLYQASFLGVSVASAPYPLALAGGFYPNTRIDSGLMHSYDPNDLRRIVCYNYKPLDASDLKGSYAASFIPFGGLATDELYLIRAECAARDSDANSAMADIDSLLSKRWRTGTFPGYTVGSAREALDTVLLERRKELAFRGLRWTDLRRLNAEGANDTLTRNLNGTLYTLAPNSSLYVLPIPPDVISLSAIAQNVRD
jgi:starch-binding outer membrane protein, SusD/RagB family